MSDIDEIFNSVEDRPRYYKRDGTPYPSGEKGLYEWANDFENPNRVIGRTSLWWGGYVSTVWLGLDHSWLGGPPLIFESMCFPEGRDQDRYSTEEQAKAGHAAMVRKWSNPRTLVKYWMDNVIYKIRAWR